MIDLHAKHDSHHTHKRPFRNAPIYAKVIENPNLKDVGYAAQTELVNDLNYMNIKPIIVDSKTILINPKLALNRLPYSKSLRREYAKWKEADALKMEYGQNIGIKTFTNLLDLKSLIQKKSLFLKLLNRFSNHVYLIIKPHQIIFKIRMFKKIILFHAQLWSNCHW